MEELRFIIRCNLRAQHMTSQEQDRYIKDLEKALANVFDGYTATTGTHISTIRGTLVTNKFAAELLNHKGLQDKEGK